MKSSDAFVPNDRLQRARSLKGWSQAELAEQIGTSFEIVSRWERGVAVPSPYYRARLCAALGQSAEDLGLVRARADAHTLPATPLVFCASSHEDAEKAIISQLKLALDERRVTLWSSRQVGRSGNGQASTTVGDIVRLAQVVLVILSPEARTSRHVREALETAIRYQRPVCGVWIAGDRWQECLPPGQNDLAAVMDARMSAGPVLIEELARALAGVGVSLPELGRPASVEAAGPGHEPERPMSSPASPARGPLAEHPVDSPAVSRQAPAEAPLRPSPPGSSQRNRRSRIRAGLLLGLVVLVIVGGLLGGASLLGIFRQPPPSVVRGGTWIETRPYDPYSFIPTGDYNDTPVLGGALYLPLFSTDTQGYLRPAAAREVPTVQNGGISPDAKTWTFRLRPGLVWSDGQPYDARDVDFTWRLWQNPAFGSTSGDVPEWSLITSAEVSADQLSITFHLQHAYVPFLTLWVGGTFAPLPAHHFSQMAPEAILQSPEKLNPQVVSGPFRMAESQPGDHFTLARNPRYYRASDGQPYLDRVIFRFADADANLLVLQAGATTGTFLVDGDRIPDYQRLTSYTLVRAPTDNTYEAMYFNFHNVVLSSHLEVRQAMAMAIDRQALIQEALHGFAHPLCTDHPSGVHPGYQSGASCLGFDLEAAKKLLEDNGWLPGPDGVRAKDGQRLEFEYSTTADQIRWRSQDETITQRNFKEIGIQLDIENYPWETFFRTFLPAGEASPPSGAIAGRFDIAEFANGYGPDPDDSWLLGCDQIPPKGGNFGSYCNSAIDALYQQELATPDAGRRQEIFQELHRYYLSDLPFIAFFGFSEIYSVRKGTHNYQPTPFEGPTVTIAEWWCDGGHC